MVADIRLIDVAVYPDWYSTTSNVVPAGKLLSTEHFSGIPDCTVSGQLRYSWYADAVPIIPIRHTAMRMILFMTTASNGRN
jgi:hypothetical protein